MEKNDRAQWAFLKKTCIELTGVHISSAVRKAVKQALVMNAPKLQPGIELQQRGPVPGQGQQGVNSEDYPRFQQQPQLQPPGFGGYQPPGQDS
eukprot:3701007-Rhodomonas_salina.1